MCNNLNSREINTYFHDFQFRKHMVVLQVFWRGGFGIHRWGFDGTKGSFLGCHREVEQRKEKRIKGFFWWVDTSRSRVTIKGG